jgi:hypothetical protein
MPWHGQASAQPGRPDHVSRHQARLARAELAAGGLTQRQRRRLQTITRAWDQTAARRKLERGHLFLVAAGAIAAMLIVAVAFALGPAIEAARGDGTTGTFTVSSSVCTPKLGCKWVGTFASPGGQPIQVNYEGNVPPGAGPGTSWPAIHPGGSSDVFATHGSHAWIPDLLLAVVIGAVVGLALWISPISLSRRKPAAATRTRRPGPARRTGSG